ncbi:MAG: hypothetical protein IPP79_09665 [Chitinophagaceae bacterium]|nr:hypothetical protein [Chitinophagaceae bacterium]
MQIVFNGEIYNFAEVKSKCSGYPFRTNGDTEALLAAYEKYGMAPGPLKGMFAFALWDSQKQELLLVRDRMGVKPLYYYADNSRLVFSSEIRPLLKSGFVPHEMSYNAVLDFFSFQSMGTGETIVKGVNQVPPGGYIRISTTTFEAGLYWDITNTREEFDFNDEKEIQKKVFSLLTSAVQRRMVGDVPIGAFYLEELTQVLW